MWLLHVETRKLEHFEGSNIPEYAILSHRWGTDEVSFQDITNGVMEVVTSRQGYSKIDQFCHKITSSEDISVLYVWIDTCCIDKSNNSELSEAINSMYRWYLRATICYAYIADVTDGNLSQLCQSVWFLRGWTLQELLAPDTVEFYDRDWNKLGTKLELADLITQITGIPADALEHFDRRRSPHSVADRMSWAARRQTTREEDAAYSLLGIFGVNMPLLYGEGGRAFLRLQEEILKISEDLTIFAWQQFPRLPPISNDYLRDTSIHDFSLFAASPAAFAHRGYRFRDLTDNPSFSERSYLETTFSGAGLTINLTLIPYCPGIYIAPICGVSEARPRQSSAPEMIAAMFVERTSHKSRYQRVVYDGRSLIVDYPTNLNVAVGRAQRLILERTPFYAMARPLRDRYGFTILHIDDDISKLFQMNSQDTIDIIKRHPHHTSLLMDPGDIGVAGMIRLRRRKLSPIYFHFGFDFDFNPFCLISRPSHESPTTKEHKIVFKSSSVHLVPVQCNTGILKLVSWLQADSRKLNLQQHNIELHMGSWKMNEMQFTGRDCKIVLDISAAHQQGYVYHVHIGLAHKDYVWAPDPGPPKWDVVSREEVKWYSKAWTDV